MRSNLLSRLLPSNPAGRSIYEDLRAHDEDSESDIEERAGMALDEENLGYHDDELAGAEVFNGEDSRMTAGSAAFFGKERSKSRSDGKGKRTKSQSGRSRWLAQSPRLLEEDGDDDVPASLLIEEDELPGPSKQHTQTVRSDNGRRQGGIPAPGGSSRETRNHWEAAQAQQRLHQEPLPAPPSMRHGHGLLVGSPRDKAMWRWINVVNLDNFIMDVYEYYQGSGMWCIVLERSLYLLLVYLDTSLEVSLTPS